MRKLETIQTREKLNEVYAVDEPGAGGASHVYTIAPVDKAYIPYVAKIRFQDGARNTAGSITGVLDTDLLEIVRDRLIAFQQGDYACTYNEKALCYLGEALKAMNDRVEDRINRGVLGTYEK